tara:strand:- start:439 stop:837 length:399 start_codon:yes stop_codon:yes gene_type:complete
MLTSAINTAISGLNASTKRLDNSANNVANVASTAGVENGQRVNKPYVPTQVENTALASGGVATTQRAVDPASTPVYDPNNALANDEGLVDYPNVDLEEEVVNQQIATYTFEANLKVIEKADEMQEDLLDITA